jgi:hypothetical protein
MIAESLVMKSRSQDGFTFNELLVSMNIVVLAVMSYTLSSVNVIRRQVSSDNSTVAIYLAKDKLEELQARRPLTDIELCPGGGDHNLSARTGSPGIFERCWRITTSSLAPDLKEIEVVLSWRDNQTHEVRLVTLAHTEE